MRLREARLEGAAAHDDFGRGGDGRGERATLEIGDAVGCWRWRVKGGERDQWVCQRAVERNVELRPAVGKGEERQTSGSLGGGVVVSLIVEVSSSGSGVRAAHLRVPSGKQSEKWESSRQVSFGASPPLMK